MTSSESKEPQGSEHSSTDVCVCGHPRVNHHWHAARGEACIGNRNLCGCRMFRSKKPVLRCKCGHDRPTHDKVTGCALPDCHCGVFRCDHSVCGWKPREEVQSALPLCLCGHSAVSHDKLTRRTCSDGTCPCERYYPRQPEEPPLTPEEEERIAARFRDADAEHLPPPEGPEYTPCVCGHIEPEHDETGECWEDDCECANYRPKADDPPPPQPERRPPYLVAYSVSGHLFEVALPGDATVRAVDGALVIQHHLGPVAGIVSVLPVINKES